MRRGLLSPVIALSRASLATLALATLALAALALATPALAAAQDTGEPAPLSAPTEECLTCHEMIHPGIVADWRASRHARVTPAQALTADRLGRRVSVDAFPEGFAETAVGCSECHTLRPGLHADTFEHNGYGVHTVVSPGDCATCHADEAAQYARNFMSQAYGNLEGNPLYQDLERHIHGRPAWRDGKLAYSDPDAATEAQGCLHCHGTKLALAGLVERETDFGPMTFPVIAGWPSQGVGRVNLDGSLGACSACHPRHGFAIEVAREPYTCKQCHVGPDVPVFKVYDASKHGNIFSTQKESWDFESVPWTVGEDFAAPTCAACHVSLLVDPESEVIAPRSHQMNDRIAWRIFGLIYSHPHPKSPDTNVIRSADGLPLPTALDGTPATEYLIDDAEQARRRDSMQTICRSCHAQSWVQEHFARYEHAHAATNAATREATAILGAIWEEGHATGPAQGGSPFDEAIEQKWCDTWLFHANSIRFTAAMAGGGDYAIFANGYYALSQATKELADWLALRRLLRETSAPGAR